MEEVVDTLIDTVERKLEKLGIDMSVGDIDEIREILDEILEKYEE